MKIIKFFAYLSVLTMISVLGGVGVLYHLYNSDLPAVDELADVSLKVPMRVFDREGRLMAEFGEERRFPVTYDEIPQVVIDAFLAAEDDRFFNHPGVDYQGLMRAAVELVRTGQKTQGGSTITMQVARNFYLGRERTYTRKLYEILLAFKIEQTLSKEEILTLYLNKIFLGHRTYGIKAAAQVYFDKELDELTVAEAAMLAALPKAPSRANPVTDPARAIGRRAYVLGRMRHLGMIDQHTYQLSMDAGLPGRLFATAQVETRSPWVAEMVRQELLARYGTAAYEMGLRVTTTIDPVAQRVATDALREALMTYDRRHGYRGAEQRWDWALEEAQDRAGLLEALEGVPVIGGLMPALVLTTSAEQAQLLARDGRRITLDMEAVRWARPRREDGRLGPQPASVGEVLRAGDVVRVHEDGDGWALAQLPEVSGAFVAVSPEDGALLALVGGFDFWHGGQFNRVTQAQRQPGSAYKTFLYSAALDHGYGLNTVVNDSPVVIRSGVTTGVDWRPRNYSGRFYGPTRLREALVRSQNLVSVRLLEAVGPQAVIDHTRRFGISVDEWQPTLSMALGSYAINPLEMTVGYSVFVNGGYRVDPYFIVQYHSQDGTAVYGHPPVIHCDDCDPDEVSPGMAPRVISPQNAFLIKSALKDITQRGTGAAAGRALQRRDIGGKTGTTNDLRDAWFAGFGPGYAATAWVGFDDYRPLGSRETGGRTALPMWVSFMEQVLPPPTEGEEMPPEGVVRVPINPDTGLRASADSSGVIWEYVDVTREGMADASALMEDAPVLREDRPDLVTDLF